MLICVVESIDGRTDLAASSSRTDPARELVVLRRLVTVYRQLSGMAVQNASLDEVAELIAQRTDSTVAIVDQQLNVLTSASSAHLGSAGEVQKYLAHPRLAQVLATVGRTRCALCLPDIETAASVIVAPILVGDDVPAYLMTLDSGDQGLGDDLRLLLTEHAATVCGVILGRDQIIAVAASSARDDIVEGLLYSRGADVSEVERWAKHLGYDSDRDHHVMSVLAEPDQLHPDPAAPRVERALVALERMLTMYAPDAIVSARGEEIVIVVPDGDAGDSLAEARQVGEMCLQRTRKSFPDVVLSIGVGGPCRAATQIATAYADARRTIVTAQRMGRRDQVVAFEDLGIHRLLLERADISQLQTFADEVLGELLRRRPEYIHTLACFFRENSSPQRAARTLHVHANTVAYRIRRVEELTGLDLANYPRPATGPGRGRDP